jgi:hypothetical protein
MKLPKIVFALAGVYGILFLVPCYFLEGAIARTSPPAITHPEYFYGFLGVSLAWQAGFLLIARDPVRYRALMLVGVLEKLGFGLPAVLLFAMQRIPASMLLAGLADLTLGAAFVLAYLRTPRAA